MNLDRFADKIVGQPGAVGLGHRGFGFGVSFAPIEQCGGLLIEAACAFDFGGSLCHGELPVLHRAQWSAEHVAGAQSMHGEVQCGLRDADTRGADADPATDEGGQRDRKPVARVAEQIRVRDQDIGEDNVGGDLTAMTHFQVGGADPHPR